MDSAPPAPSASPAAPRLSRRALGLVFLAAAGLALLLHLPSALHDTDAYYHLAVGRLYAEQGIVDDMPALRLSLLRDGFGDKEFLFHLLLAPLVETLPPLGAGRVALALWTAAIATLLAALASRVLGAWGALFPFWLFFASTELSWRLVRLRPELLSLTLLLLAIWAMAAGRDRRLAPIAFAYTLGYTAFHALLGLVGLGFLLLGRLEHGRRWRDWPWRMPLYATLGSGLGLILHPHFPQNLQVWWVQNVTFFTEKAALNVGSEIRPNTTDVVLMVHLGLFAALLALTLAARPRDANNRLAPAEEDAVDRRLALLLALATAVFGLLYLLMSRFSLYFWPFATLALLFGLRARGLEIGDRVRLPGGRSVPLAAALALGLLLSAPEAWRQFQTYRERTALGPADARLRDREQLSAALPAGAKVAADWGPTATYLLWAPQALFLNALDPVFMAQPYPQAQARLRAILDGREADVPLATLAVLDSDYLAYPTVGHEALSSRLQGDPRVVLLHRGSHVLVQFRPTPTELAVDWRVAPDGVKPPLDPIVITDAWPRYPLLADPRLRVYEAYVDADRLGPAPCRTFVRDLPAGASRVDGPAGASRVDGDAVGRVDGDAVGQTGASRVDGEPAGASRVDGDAVELAVRGTAEIWADRTFVARVPGVDAQLGQGVTLRLPPGTRRATLRVCETAPGSGKGFYWLQRSSQ